jgi:hypothetical protein
MAGIVADVYLQFAVSFYSDFTKNQTDIFPDSKLKEATSD